MTTIEVFRAVKDSGQCHLARARKDAPGQYDAKPYGAGNKRGWFYVDIFTAGAVLSVWAALTEANRAVLEALPVQRAACVAMRLIR